MQSKRRPEDILKALEKAMQSMVLEHPTMSAEQICHVAFGTNPDTGKPNKSQYTLFRELNPNDPGAKLGVITLVLLMQATGVHRPLEEMAAFLEKFVYSGTPVPDRATSREEGADDLREVAVMQAMMAEGANASTVQTQAMRACDDIMQTAIKYAEEEDACGLFERADNRLFAS